MLSTDCFEIEVVSEPA